MDGVHPRFRVGDCTTSGDVVDGFIDQFPDEPVAGRHASADYLLFEPRSGIRKVASPDNCELDESRPRGPLPLDGVAPITLSDAWRARLDAFLFGPDNQAVLKHLSDLVPEDDLLLVGGGVVRRLLRGEEAPRCDVDLAGTLSTKVWRRLAQQAHARALGAAEPEDVDQAIRLESDSRVTAATLAGETLEIEYAPFTRRREAHPLSNGQMAWVFGSSLREDAEWRDVSCNTVFYSWRDGCLLAPHDEAISDLGVTRARLDRDERDDLTSVRVRPLPLRVELDLRDVSARVARIAKVIKEEASRTPDVVLVTAWVEKWRVRLDELIETDRARVAQGSDPQLLKDLRAKSCAFADIPGRAWPYMAALGPVWDLIQGFGPGPAVLGTSRTRLQGDALAELHLVGGRWTPGRVDGPEPPGREAARRYFGPLFNGYAHALVSVDLDDREIEALVLCPPHGEGTWYLELRENQPIPITERGLAELQEAERPT
jgi:hypothetical protein